MYSLRFRFHGPQWLSQAVGLYLSSLWLNLEKVCKGYIISSSSHFFEEHKYQGTYFGIFFRPRGRKNVQDLS